MLDFKVTTTVTRNQKKDNTERHQKLKYQRKLRRLLENLQKKTNDSEVNIKSRKNMRKQDISRITRIKEELTFSFWMHGI